MARKVILVTGVSRGIGKCIVSELLDVGEGSDVVVYGVARSEGPLIELKNKYGELFNYVVGDISEDSVLEELVEKIKEAYGYIDSIIANAGILEPVSNVNMIDGAAWKHLFDVNFFSIVSLVSKTIGLVSARKGTYVFVSSGASVKPYYGWGAYGASKAALNHFASTLANEESSIKCVAIAPGVVDTQMQVDIRGKYGPAGMTKDALKRFTDLYKNNQLLDSSVPAKLYANLASRGIPDNCNGLYLRYDDDKLKDFAD
ncbi:hypothetical protein TPHA_0N01910 [Tetrapisispora phaffii CBS 4417]|uniref:Uncharacterized protein n=1 Tax=Tetrapisispora phaffii (strain ATCC 24235 / CBS 4417 / NBRC 1672 / NRRL Y-8282 / UCD 70-5) TaxID=1071381 RepID=G8C1E4_TETPH|nr:hypothetical protein TPHA_0N01910 [Tetrapisispora phaffii CBS 4417]CCE65972.1 hypothetical protein TPHA_0N01910 [Tetrapisispora phaffii CBS 4417]